jgi:hypothetical protein
MEFTHNGKLLQSSVAWDLQLPLDSGLSLPTLSQSKYNSLLRNITPNLHTSKHSTIYSLKILPLVLITSNIS